MFVCTHTITEERFGQWRCCACGKPLRPPLKSEALASDKGRVQTDALPDTSAGADPPRETTS